MLEPGDGFIEAAEADQVGADVVIGIAEIGIDSDGALALGDGVLDLALEVIGPAEKSVRFGGGIGFEGILVEHHGTVQFAGHLGLVGFLKQLPGARDVIVRHGSAVGGLL